MAAETKISNLGKATHPTLNFTEKKCCNMKQKNIDGEDKVIDVKKARI